MINIITPGIPSSILATIVSTLGIIFCPPHLSLVTVKHPPFSLNPPFSSPPAYQSSPTSPMASLDVQLAQAVEAITMLLNSMVAMQQQVAILTQNIHEQQQRMLQPIVPVHAPLSPLNIPLPPLPPSPPCCPSPYMQGQYVPPSESRNWKLQLPFTLPENMTKLSCS